MMITLLLLSVLGRMPSDDEEMRRTRAYRETEEGRPVEAHGIKLFHPHVFELDVGSIQVHSLPLLQYFSTVPQEHEAIAPLNVSVTRQDGSVHVCKYQLGEQCECHAADTVKVDFIRTERAWTDARDDNIQVHRLEGKCDQFTTMLKVDARLRHQVLLQVLESQIEQPKFPRSEASMDIIDDAIVGVSIPNVNYDGVIVLRVAFMDEYGQKAQVELTAGVDAQRVLREASSSISLEYIRPGFSPDITGETYRVHTATLPMEGAAGMFSSGIPEWMKEVLDAPYRPLPVDSFPRSLGSKGEFEVGAEVEEDLCYRVRVESSNEKVFSLTEYPDLLDVILPPYELECLDAGKRSFKVVSK